MGRSAGVRALQETPHRVLSDGETDAVVQLIARQASLKAALEIAQAILAGNEADSTWRLIARRARRLVQADVALVRTPAPDGRTLVLRGFDRRRVGAPQPGILFRQEPTAGSICGAVLESGRGRIVDFVHAIPRTGTDALQAEPDNVIGRIPLGPAVVVPLGARGAALGVLTVISSSDRPPFRQGDVDLLRLFAGQAAQAIQQAEIRRERQRLSVIHERERLARELHDDAVQSLYGITLDLASAAARTEDPVLRERMAGLVWTVDSVIQDLRNHIYGLRPSVLAGRRLDEALRQLARDFERQSGATAVVEVESEAAERLRDQASDVVQIVREALSNVGRHARARNCRLHLGLHQGDAWLVVEDDGVGFDPGQVGTGGYGLRNFEERVSQLGGRLEIDSSPNSGTALRIAIPLRPSLTRSPGLGRRHPSAGRRRVL
jgi:signal transduction histidine kinase